MSDKEFLEHLLRYIPRRHRECADADYTYSNLRFMISERLGEKLKNKNLFTIFFTADDIPDVDEDV